MRTPKEEEINRIMNGLHVSREEAIEIWLDDEGETENAEQNALDEKAKKVKIDHGAMSQEVIERKFKYDKTKEKTQKERVKKVNTTKAKIIKALAEMLTETAENVQIVNDEKLIIFDMDGHNYKLDLTQTRQKKT